MSRQRTIATATAAGSINKVEVFYADGEYTTHIRCDQVAQEHARQLDPHWPLLVHTVEHGGWGMVHYFDDRHPQGICVGSANDAAVFGPEAQAIRDALFPLERKWLPEIRRTAGGNMTAASFEAMGEGLARFDSNQAADPYEPTYFHGVNAWGVIHPTSGTIVSGAESRDHAAEIARDFAVRYPGGPDQIDAELPADLVADADGHLDRQGHVDELLAAGPRCPRPR